MKLGVIDVSKWDAEVAETINPPWNPTPEQFAAYRKRECELAARAKAKGFVQDDCLFHPFSWAGILP